MSRPQSSGAPRFHPTTKASSNPNSDRTLNDYADRYMHLLTGAEWKVLSYTAGRVFRFQAREGRISLTQYQRGTRGRDGEQLDHGTGLGRKTIIKCLDSLIRFPLVVRTGSVLGSGSDFGRGAPRYITKLAEVPLIK